VEGNTGEIKGSIVLFQEFYEFSGVSLLLQLATVVGDIRSGKRNLRRGVRGNRERTTEKTFMAHQVRHNVRLLAENRRNSRDGLRKTYGARVNAILKPMLGKEEQET